MCLIVPEIIKIIVKEHGVDELTATKDFYDSKVYALLEDEETGMWHFSPRLLFTMYDEERKTGSFYIPVEG